MLKTMTVRATIAAILAGLSVSAYAIADSSRRIDIPAGDLRQALLKVSEQFGADLVFQPDQLKSLRTAGVSGTYSPEEAIRILLKGTPLQLRTDASSGAMVIAPPPTAPKSTPAVPPQTVTPAEASSGSFWSRLRLAQSDARAASQVEEEAKPGDSLQSRKRVEGEEIVVTGSRMPLTETEASFSTITIDREQIDRMGVSSLREVFAQTPQLSVVRDNNTSIAFGLGAPIQLRGLPLGTTLVLVNGRRTVSGGAGASTGFFDTNNIPLAAVDRIEIVATGASAVYGADAAAGVVNIILKREHEGLELAARAASLDPSHELQGSAVFGRTFSRGQFLLALDARETSELIGADRERWADIDYRRLGGPDRRVTTCNPGTAYAVTGTLPGAGTAFAAVPTSTTGQLTAAAFVATAGQRNLCNLRAESGLVPEASWLGTLAAGQLNLNDAWSVRAEHTLSNQSSLFSSGDPVFSGGATSTFRVGAANPYNPFGTDVTVDYIFAAPSSQEVDSEYTRSLVAAEYRFGTSWSAELGVWRTKDRLESKSEGNLDPAQARAALLSSDPATALNPFAPVPGSPALLSTIVRSGPVQPLQGTARQIDLVLKGELFDLPAGVVRAVAGAESRDEDIFVQGLASSIALGNVVTASRSARAVFAELYVPVTDRIGPLGITLAGRQDRYSDFGTARSPQVGLSWAPTAGLLVRASHSESFRAPTLFQLFNAPTFNQLRATDPRRNGESVVVDLFGGGNPDLQPEEGESMTAGILFRPHRDWSVSLDWWRLEFSRRLVFLNSTVLLQNEALFPDRVVRDAPTPADVAAGLPGRILSLDTRSVNAGLADVEGYDLNAEGHIAMWGGFLRTSVSASLTEKYAGQTLPTAPVENRRGIANADGFAPRLKGVVRVGWTRGMLNTDLSMRHTAKYRDYALAGFPARDVAEQNLVDLQLNFQFSANTQAGVGATNLFDEAAPYSHNALGYDPLQSTLLGRRVYVNVRRKF